MKITFLNTTNQNFLKLSVNYKSDIAICKRFFYNRLFIMHYLLYLPWKR